MSVFVLILGSILFAQSASPGYRAYQRANDLFLKQQFPASLDAVEEALRLDAKLVPALTLRAKLAMAANRTDLARADLERAVAIDAKSAYAQFLLGLVLYQLNELRLALPPLEAASKLTPKDPRAPLYLGLCQESLGDADAAAALYEKAIRLEEAAGQPQAETYLIAARLQFLLDHVDAAEKLVQKAIRRNAASREAHFEYARIAAHGRRFDLAVREANLALTLPRTETTDQQIHALLARSYQALGDSSNAARHAQAARE